MGDKRSYAIDLLESGEYGRALALIDPFKKQSTRRRTHLDDTSALTAEVKDFRRELDGRLNGLLVGLTGIEVLHCSVRGSTSKDAEIGAVEVRKHFDIRGQTVHGLVWQTEFWVAAKGGATHDLLIRMPPHSSRPFEGLIERATQESNPHLFLSTLSQYALHYEERHELFSRIHREYPYCTTYNPSPPLADMLKYTPSRPSEFTIAFHWAVRPLWAVDRPQAVASSLVAYPHISPSARPVCGDVVVRLPGHFQMLVRRFGAAHALRTIIRTTRVESHDRVRVSVVGGGGGPLKTRRPAPARRDPP